MQVALYKITPHINEKYKTAFADFRVVIRGEKKDFLMWIKGCLVVSCEDGRLNIYMPKLQKVTEHFGVDGSKITRIACVPFTPFSFAPKEQHLEFIYKAVLSIKNTWPAEKWCQGVWCASKAMIPDKTAYKTPKISDKRLQALMGRPFKSRAMNRLPEVKDEK